MKEKILRATAKIISTNGMESASTRAICEAVGISAPTLYYHFKGKTELLSAVTEFAFNLQRGKKLSGRTSDAISNLRYFWDEFIAFSFFEGELHRTMMVSISQGNSIEAGYGCFSDLVAEFECLEKSGDLRYPALQSAQIYLGAAQGISLILMAHSKRSKKDPPLSLISRDIVLNGLLRPEEF